MKDYGSSPLGFACHFGAKGVVGFMLSHPRTCGILDLNKNPCPLTGLYPFHAAVTSGDIDGVKFLLSLDGLDRFTRNHKSADLSLLTKDSRNGYGELTPLQLAVKRGDKALAEFMILERAVVQWQWGPVMSIAIPLDEIDSSGPSPSDVMQLLDSEDDGKGRPGLAQQLILDTFMDGFLFELFRVKWQRFARGTLVMLIILDILTFVPLVIVGMEIRLAREDRTWWMPYWVMTGALLQIGLDVLAISAWLEENGGVRGLWTRRSRQRLYAWMQRNSLQQNLVVFLATMAGCGIAAVEAGAGHDEATLKMAQRIMLAGAVYLDVVGLMGTICIPFQRLGIFSIVVDQLCSTDLPVFVMFLGGYAFTFLTTMYIAYPVEYNEQLDVCPPFNDLLTAAKAMLDLSTTGERFGMYLGGAWVEKPWENDKVLWNLNLLVFAFFYYLCMLLMHVLFLRLFMALLSDRFAAVKRSATLAWRLNFLRWVLYAELLQPSFMGPTWSGELLNGQWACVLQKPQVNLANRAKDKKSAKDKKGGERQGVDAGATTRRARQGIFVDKVETIKRRLKLAGGSSMAAFKVVSDANALLGIPSLGSLAHQVDVILRELEAQSAPPAAAAAVSGSNSDSSPLPTNGRSGIRPPRNSMADTIPPLEVKTQTAPGECVEDKVMESKLTNEIMLAFDSIARSVTKSLKKVTSVEHIAGIFFGAMVALVAYQYIITVVSWETGGMP
uniref:Ion transport domain-containing protein n=1 Tax=Haptolina ericina TaxID=156174 RepID=A0A7S3EYV7_9EUKA